MKFDKLSIIGIALALALIILQMQYSAKNRQDLEQQEAQQQEQVDTTQSPDSTASSTESISPALPDNFTEEEIILENESASFTFSTATGGIKRVTFPDQHEVNQEDVPVSLNRFGLKSIGGLQSSGGDPLDAGYKVLEQSEKGITFLGKLENGLIVKKQWEFLPEEEKGAPYRLNYSVLIENAGEVAVEASDLNFYVGGATPLYKKELPDQSGFYYLADGKYKKKKSNPLKKKFYTSKLKSLEDQLEQMEFVGVGNQFFTCFLSAKTPYNASYRAETRAVELPEEVGGGLKNEITVSVSLPQEKIEAGGGKEQFEYELYAGPKRYQTLKRLSEKKNGGLVMNYGFFKPISGVLNNILSFLHDKIFINSGTFAWGLAIIALTVVIRIFMWPLHNVSARSMKRMTKLQPKIQELKEKYPDDPQKVQTEQMKLFGEYGINPVGGCLPMLAQIPIFFGLFTMLKSAVEFRHEGFLWINDLSQPDTIFSIPIPGLNFAFPINILPILMFITMAIQMSMNPTPTDPTQKFIMRLMPLMMVVFCYNFASALALYWTTSNVFTIFQTWLMKKLPEPELKKKEGKKPKKGGFMERLQKQAEEMQRMQEQQKKGGGRAGSSQPPMRNAKPKKKRGPKTGG